MNSLNAELSTGSGSHEKRALAWLTWGSLIPVVGWLYGVVRMWSSRVWKTREKIIGTLALPFGFWGVIWVWWSLGWASEQRCTRSESGTASSVGGAPTGTAQEVDHGCEQIGTILPSAAWLTLLAALAIAVAGPWWLSRQLHTRKA